MKTPRILVVTLLLLAGLPPVDATDDSVVEWIRAHAVPLKTVEAGHGFSDMGPLKSIVGDARIVSLGEATHGTREFFQLKHRMLEFLASQMGFTIFSIEANMPEAYRLNDYVLNGNGDPAKLLKGMYFWTWDTEEVLDMIRWMREFNKSGRGHIEFTGFDMQTPDVAIQNVHDFVAKNDPQYLETLEHDSEVVRSIDRIDQRESFGVATATFPVKDAAGKKIRFSGYIKTQNVTSGWAGLWWRVDGSSGVLAFDNMHDRGVAGTTDWKHCEINLPVAEDAKNINFGAILTGGGTAWFDELKIELDGVAYTSANDFDLGFGGPAPRGFHTGGRGYKVQLDTQVFHEGKQSLQLAKAETPPVASKSDDAMTAVASWKQIMDHIEGTRQSYFAKGVTAKDIDWAAQNVRIVLQCMQMKSGTGSRHQSMAENIKWIADHSPGAKIVVWAHNGHISTNSARGFGAMGASLRSMFGNQMVVFGLAFNQGSFQAVESGKGLRNFTVPPAPMGGLDSTLAATGIPVFAFDLRAAPKDGPIAVWLNQSHATRAIGAMYSEDSPGSYIANLKVTDCYDAILFVEKTTAAHKNPGW